MDQPATTLLGEAKTILLATDGSPFSEGAVREAFFFGQACKAKVIVLHVVNTTAESIGAANFAVRQGREALAPHLAHVRSLAQAGGVETETVVIGSSKPEKTLVEQARLRKADVIVMGRRGQAGHLSRLVGKMTTRVIAQKFPRVLVAPKDCRIAGSHILAAVDDSANGRRVVQEALSLGHSCSTLQKMTVVSVAAKEDARALAERLVHDVCRQAEQEQVPVPCAPLVAVGEPASVLAAVARDLEVDMILIGGWGRSGVAKLLKGHVTDNVIGRAHCAVLVVTA